jgi:O-antigen/teichoic acid export membrane protein
MLKVFFKDSLIYAIPSIISRGMSLFLVPLYTRVLSPADYGSLDLLMVFAGIVNLTIALEVSQGIARFYSEEKILERKILYASSGFWFTTFVYIIFAIVSFFYSNSLSYLVLGKKGLTNVFEIGIIYICINGIFYLTQNQFRWELKSKEYAIVSLLSSIVTAAVSIWLAYYFKYGLVGLLIGMLSGSLVATIFGIIWLRNSFQFRFELTYLKEMLSFSSPLVLSGIAIWLSGYMDRIIINHYFNLEEVGLYGVGFRIASIVTILITSFQSALSPLIYTNYNKPDTRLKLAILFRYFLVFALLFYIIITLFDLDILKLLTQPKFYKAQDVMIYLVPSILFSQMYIFAPGIFIVKKTNYLIWIQFLGVFINLLLNFIFIPIMGFTGAALATMLSQALVFSILMYFSQIYYSVPHLWSKYFISIFLTLAIIIISQIVNLTGYTYYLFSFSLIMISLFSFIGLGLVRIVELKSLAFLIYNKLYRK